MTYFFRGMTRTFIDKQPLLGSSRKNIGAGHHVSDIFLAQAILSLASLHQRIFTFFSFLLDASFHGHSFHGSWAEFLGNFSPFSICDFLEDFDELFYLDTFEPPIILLVISHTLEFYRCTNLAWYFEPHIGRNIYWLLAASLRRSLIPPTPDMWIKYFISID